jgi:arsenate reductase-like glutaredoxin family protein
LLEQGAQWEERDLGAQKLSVEELDNLIDKRNHLEFLNTRNELYRARDMKNHPPSRAQAIKWMAEEPNLIRRPILIKGGELMVGWDEAKAKRLI